ncbi:hypothetical protein B0H19DRAFT_1261520 [Mycena capillaripes]|nr:hypothetical protein B0H19DRAFT_1261520 [Mycena capillaripes]
MQTSDVPSHNGVHTLDPRSTAGDRLPQSVEDVRQSFTSTVQAIAVVTTLFAGIQAQLLSSMPFAPSPTASKAVIKALLLTGYGGLVVNVGAALSGMIFLDIAGEAPEAFRRSKSRITTMRQVSITNGDKPIGGLEQLLLYGSPRTLQFAWYHCVVSTLFGAFSILIQISLLAWINISSHSEIFVFVVLALIWAALPLPVFLIYNFCVGFVTSLKRELEST